jgi:uncharacterized protein (DUF1697 family)
MKYIALLRGINVGGNKKVAMKKLKVLFELLGCINVSTYINSGNIFFESSESRETLHKYIESRLKKEFGFAIRTLIKTKQEMKKISDDIPKTWLNDGEQKTDVAYLFKEIDCKETVNALPVKKEFISLKYVDGAIIWNVKRINVNKSNLTKIISQTSYRSMTVRNVNTARYLAEKDC